MNISKVSIKKIHKHITWGIFGIIGTTLLSSIITVMYTPSSFASPVTGFNAGNIISDAIFTDSGSMSVAQIQAFLNSKVPTCDTQGTGSYTFSGVTKTGAQWAQYWYNTASAGSLWKTHPAWASAPFTCLKDYSENGISSAQIIYNAAQQYQINPQVLITLLQKEQGIVTDTWPTGNEYLSATGYGCPDNASCNSQYYGLTNQINHAASMFHSIMTRNPNWYSPYTLGNQQILWNPSSSCGSGNVNIQNLATVALYDYTPYQPNAAALAAGLGTGDSCSSYGNRNFYVYFTQWFGSTVDDINLQRSSTDPTVYVVYNNHKQGIPSPDVLSAWGLDRLPVYTVDATALSGIPDGGVLTRLVKNPYTPGMLLLADNGGYLNAWPAMIQNYGIDPSTASTVGPQLLTMASWSSNLSDFITTSSIGGVLLVDGGTYHSIASQTVLHEWGGSNPTINNISSSLFSQLTQNTSYGVFNGIATTANGNRYLIDNGIASPLQGIVSANYPTINQVSISPALINTLTETSPLSPFVQSSSGGAVYLIDNGQKDGFPTPDLLSAYQQSLGTTSVSVMSPSALDLIPNGPVISNDFVYNLSSTGTGYYLSSTGAQSVNQNFNTSNYGIGLSATTIQGLKTTTSLACGSDGSFVDASGNPTIYMIEDGVKRPITSMADLTLLDTNMQVCQINQTSLNAIPSGSIITPFVTTDNQSYLIASGKYYTLTDAVLAQIGATPVSISQSTLSNYTPDGAFDGSFIIGNTYYKISDGKYYSTTNKAVGQLWGVSSQNQTSNLLSKLKSGGELTAFVQSSNTSDHTIYVFDDTQFHGFPTYDAYINAGGAGKNLVTILDTTLASQTGYVWSGYIAKDPSNALWVLDGGVKRPLSSSNSSAWIGTQTPMAVSNNYLSTLSTGDYVTLGVKSSSNPTIYGMVNGQKRGIPTASMYTGSIYSPASTISTSLLEQIPTGPVL